MRSQPPSSPSHGADPSERRRGPQARRYGAVAAARWMRRFGKRFGLGHAISIALLSALIAIRVWDPLPIEALRCRVFDTYQIVKPRPVAAEHPVVIVDIDEDSIRDLGQWPWPRTMIADLVDELTRLGAIVVGFDVIFAESDRLSPDALAASLPNLTETSRNDLRSQPPNDEVLATAMKRSRVVLGQTATAQPLTWSEAGPPPQTGVAIVGPRPDLATLPMGFPGLMRNVAVLEQAAAGRGVLTISPEGDGIVRRVPMVINAGGAIVPALSLEIMRVLAEADSILVRTDELGIRDIRLKDFALPTDPAGQIWAHFSPHDPGKFTSARDVLGGKVAAERFQNKIVLIGTSAVGLLDLKTTPIDRAMPGVEIHAQLLENMLTGTTLVMPNNATVIELAIVAAVSLALLILAPFVSAGGLLILGSAVAASLAYLSWRLYTQSAFLLDATFPLAASFAVYFTITFTNYYREQRGRARIRSAFGQYLSPALVEQLAQSPEKLRLGGEERRLTILFSDMRGFTAIAEFYKHDPAGLTHLVNRFLSPLTNAILDRKGTIDKYMGDAVMAFWNAPLDDDAHETNAAQAALDMLQRIDELNTERKAEAVAGGFPVLPLDLGIGINTGACIVGNMGSDLRFDYSVLGDSVNLASRFESQTKYYGVKIIVGAATAARIADRYALLEIDSIRVKGKEEPEIISALIGDTALRTSETFLQLAKQHRAMIDAYRRRDWDAVTQSAAACRALAGGLKIDPLYQLYETRAVAFKAEPPPEDWAGVHTAETK